MSKLAYFEIAGKVYPLSFSLMAQIKLAERYGTLSAIGDYIAGDDAKSFLEGAYILELLISQGCAYKNMFESDVPHDKNAPVIDGKYVPLTNEQILIGVNASKQKEMWEAIGIAMGRGMEQEIETSEKNVGTLEEAVTQFGLNSGEEC